MKKIAYSLLSIALLLCPPLLVAQGTSTTHYYLYEFTTEYGNAAVIFEINSDNPTSPGSEFSEVTIDQLHNKGYQSPGEYETNACVYDGFTDPQTFWSGGSWIDTIHLPSGGKRVVCGSKTARNLWEGPGPLYVACSTYSMVVLPFRGPRSCVFAREHSTWGYYTKIAVPFDYSQLYTIVWEQKGRHHTGNPNNMRYSRATVRF